MHMVKFLFAKEKVLGQFLNPLMSKWKHKGIRIELLTADYFQLLIFQAISNFHQELCLADNIFML